MESTKRKPPYYRILIALALAVLFAAYQRFVLYRNQTPGSPLPLPAVPAAPARLVACAAARHIDLALLDRAFYACREEMNSLAYYVRSVVPEENLRGASGTKYLLLRNELDPGYINEHRFRVAREIESIIHSPSLVSLAASPHIPGNSDEEALRAYVAARINLMYAALFNVTLLQDSVVLRRQIAAGTAVQPAGMVALYGQEWPRQWIENNKKSELLPSIGDFLKLHGEKQATAARLRAARAAADDTRQKITELKNLLKLYKLNQVDGSHRDIYDRIGTLDTTLNRHTAACARLAAELEPLSRRTGPDDLDSLCDQYLDMVMLFCGIDVTPLLAQ